MAEPQPYLVIDNIDAVRVRLDELFADVWHDWSDEMVGAAAAVLSCFKDVGAGCAPCGSAFIYNAGVGPTKPHTHGVIDPPLDRLYVLRAPARVIPNEGAE